MDVDLAALPQDVDALHRLIRDLAAQREGKQKALSAAQVEIERLRLIVQNLQRLQFGGRRAERLDGDQLELGLEDLGADIGRAEELLPATPADKAPAARDRLDRPSLPDHLEREEVTGERIRDKFAASRRKGLWMGGTTPLGYRAENRQLVVHEADAKLVRHIYRRFLALGNVATLYSEFKAKGIKRSIHTTERGKAVGGRQFGRGTLDHILQNGIYRGIIVYKGETHPGRHRSIVSQDLWDRVQTQLQVQREKWQVRAVESPHLLIGRIRDDQGHMMSPTYARNRNGQQYRYYVSRPLLNRSGEKVGSISRVPATSIEAFVATEILGRISASEAKQWSAAIRAERARFLRDLIAGVVVGREEVEIVLTLKGLDLVASNAIEHANSDYEKSLRIRVPVRLKWWGGAKTITSIDGVTPTHPTPERNIIRVLAYAHRWRALLKSGKASTVRELARSCSDDISDIASYLPLAFLSPRIIHALTDRDRPLAVSLARLVECGRAVSWVDQERLLLDGS
jgi:site-specific DNA recombinase